MLAAAGAKIKGTEAPPSTPELLYVPGGLYAVHRLVAAVLNFDRNVCARIVVGMEVEVQRDGQAGGRVEINLDSADRQRA